MYHMNSFECWAQLKTSKTLKDFFVKSDMYNSLTGMGKTFKSLGSSLKNSFGRTKIMEKYIQLEMHLITAVLGKKYEIKIIGCSLILINLVRT